MKVLIAVDNSGYSEAVIRSVCNRAWSPETEFEVVTVVEPSIPEAFSWHTAPVPFLAEAQMQLVESCRLKISDYVNHLKQLLPGHAVSGKVIEGNVCRSLIEEATDWEADFMILGSHGRTGWDKLLLGSVAEAVLSQAPCSVEIIRRKAENRLHQHEPVKKTSSAPI